MKNRGWGTLRVIVIWDEEGLGVSAIKAKTQVHKSTAKMGSRLVLRIWAGAEDGGANANFCGAFLDSDFEVVGHAHG